MITRKKKLYHYVSRPNYNSLRTKTSMEKYFKKSEVVQECHLCKKEVRYSHILGSDCEVSPEDNDIILKFHMCKCT
jgi:translation elongation factor P/translation initiation factor 5A